MARTIMLDRTSGDEMRALARSLAEKSGKQWDRLPFGEIVYWLHKAMVYVDGSEKRSSKPAFAF